MDHSRRTWRALALLFAGVLLFSACADDTTDNGTAGQGDGDEPTRVKLAFACALNDNLGKNIYNGALLAIEQANEEHEGEFVFELEEFDTAGDPAQASTVKDQFIPDEEILGLVGPCFSGETKAILPDLHAAGLAMISPSATAVDLVDVVSDTPVFHRLVPDDDVQGAAAAEYITDQLNVKNAGFIHDNTDYGKGLAEATQKALESQGVTTVFTEAINPESEDYSAAVNRARSATIDMVFYGGYYEEAGRLKRQLEDGRVNAIFMSGDGALDPGFIEAAGDEAAEEAQMTCACNLATENSEGELGEFATAYNERFNQAPGTYSSEGYDAAGIFIEGIVAGNDTREELLDFIEQLEDYEGISKTINFEENGNIGGGSVFVFRVTGGEITLVGATDEL